MSTSKLLTPTADPSGNPVDAPGNERSEDTEAYGNLQRVSITQIPRVIRQVICVLLVGQGLDGGKCERILEQLLHYARVWQRSLEQGGDVAVIAIPNLLQMYRRDRWMCCCYQTANTFIRLLCALRLLYKHREPGGSTEYYLPLTEDFAFHPDNFMLAELDKLCDPLQTKNRRVRAKAAEVKRRLLLLSSATLQDQAQMDTTTESQLLGVTTTLRRALAQVDAVLRSVGKLEGKTRLQVMANISVVLAELFQASRFSPARVDSWTAGGSFPDTPGVDSVDSRRLLKRRESTNACNRRQARIYLAGRFSRPSEPESTTGNRRGKGLRKGWRSQARKEHHQWESTDRHLRGRFARPYR